MKRVIGTVIIVVIASMWVMAQPAMATWDFCDIDNRSTEVCEFSNCFRGIIPAQTKLEEVPIISDCSSNYSITEIERYIKSRCSNIFVDKCSDREGHYVKVTRRG